ncbi:MAG: MBL fold metallo-hydrolase [Candidatus Omnitrophica bacterium]|nr:MBL fold metallo-hydrolase [Candidatus Omnitrophota bacterium]
MSILSYNLHSNANTYNSLRIGLLLAGFVLFGSLFCTASLFSQSINEDVAQQFLHAIHWYGHGSFRIELEGETVYIDPWNLPNAPKADYILITNPHFGHFSKEDINTLKTAKTVIVAVKAVAAKIDEGSIKIIEPGQKLRFGSLVIEAVPAYTVTNNYFPREKDYAGYLISNAHIRIYCAGSTDVVPEMEQIRCDIALLPVSGAPVMGPEEAAQATRIIKPSIAIPMHYGAIIGSIRDAHRFKDLAETRVEILGIE